MVYAHPLSTPICTAVINILNSYSALDHKLMALVLFKNITRAFA